MRFDRLLDASRKAGPRTVKHRVNPPIARGRLLILYAISIHFDDDTMQRQLKCVDTTYGIIPIWELIPIRSRALVDFQIPTGAVLKGIFNSSMEEEIWAKVRETKSEF